MTNNKITEELLDKQAFINKLKWRSMRRSLLEVDLYLECFIVSGGLDALSIDELFTYAQLLDLADIDLLPLLQGDQLPLPAVNELHITNSIQQAIIAKIIKKWQQNKFLTIKGA